jgi:hypothetical protein
MWESLLDDHASNSQIDKLDGVAVKQVLESHGVKVEKLRDDIKRSRGKMFSHQSMAKRRERAVGILRTPADAHIVMATLHGQAI